MIHSDLGTAWNNSGDLTMRVDRSRPADRSSVTETIIHHLREGSACLGPPLPAPPRLGSARLPIRLLQLGRGRVEARTQTGSDPNPDRTLGPGSRPGPRRDRPDETHARWDPAIVAAVDMDPVRTLLESNSRDARHNL